MSVVIAIKEKDRFVLGSDKQISFDNIKEHAATKIWRPVELPEMVIGSIGLARATQILQVSPIIDKNSIYGEINTDFIIRSVIPNIVATLKAGGINVELKEKDICTIIPNDLILAYQDKAWIIYHDLSVVEITDSLAIGSGSDIAKGVLFATKNKNPFERAVMCIEAASKSNLWVDNSVDILTTKFYDKDIKLLNKALGIPDDLVVNTEA